MKKHLLHLFVLFLFVSSGALKAQVVLQSFDNAVKDTLWSSSTGGGKSKITLTDDAQNKKEGLNSLNVKAYIDSLFPWGSFAQIYYIPKDKSLMDISSYDSLSIWIKVNVNCKRPDYMVYRIQLADKGADGKGDEEQYIYENATILDQAHDWVQLKVPLYERNQPGTDIPDSTGFILAPTSWGGFNYNNKTLDRNKISQITVGIITSGYTAPRNLPPDTMDVNYDGLTLFGTRKIQFVVFNGKVLSPEMKLGSWGSGGSISVVPNAGSVPGKAALKWVSGNDWGGWGGWYADFPEKNMGGNWKMNDTIKLRVKVPADFNDDIRVQFDSKTSVPGNKEGIGKAKYIFKKADYNWDGTWKTLSCPLKGWVKDGDYIGFDSTQVNKFEIIGETGKLTLMDVYFEDIWMGSPVFDVIAPKPVTNLKSTAGQYTNLITWQDVPDEPGAKYDVYYSPNPITDVKASGVEVVATGVVENVMTANHNLRAPNTDQPLQYYYAVTCTDAAGNTSEVASVAGPSNIAKGVPTISLTVPSNFKADGDLSEWTAAGIKPIVIKPSDGSGTIAPNQKIDGDADLSLSAYLAVDKDNLYVAFDVTDDAVYADPSASSNSYERDCPDLFLGLYDFHGEYHKSYARGATPDYHFRFNKDRVFFDGQSLDTLFVPGDNYTFQEKLENGYTVEAKIPFVDIATKRNKGFTGTLDNVFVPAEGMRIPIDFSINDNDNGSSREGILCYSPANNDNSWGDVTRWLYTWIGNKMYVTGVEEATGATVKNYSLSQNYPNPFNPSTSIRYSITKPGMVTLKVYDVVGREVANLVNKEQSAGSYQINFDASSLSSGIYFYRLQSGEFSATNKMMLIK